MKFEKYEIRLIKKEDAFPYFQLIENNRPRLEDFIAGIASKTKNRTDTEIFMDEIIEKNTNRTYFPYIIIDTSNEKFVGFFDVKNIDWNIPKAEIGYFIDKNYTGKGLASNFLKTMISHYLNNLEFKKIVLRIHKENIPSIKVAENCGFEKEGIIKNDYKKMNGEVVDMIYYGKTNQQIK
jgi:RimJ/RimL family protein N-acetyltransferase